MFSRTTLGNKWKQKYFDVYFKNHFMFYNEILFFKLLIGAITSKPCHIPAAQDAPISVILCCKL
jgi:hypothetical protein